MPDFNSRRLHFVLFPVCCVEQRIASQSWTECPLLRRSLVRLAYGKNNRRGERHFRFNPVGVDFLLCDDVSWKPGVMERKVW